MLTYEAPKQSPPALKEEENGDSNIQVGHCWGPRARDGEGRLVGRSLLAPSVNLRA